MRRKEEDEREQWKMDKEKGNRQIEREHVKIDKNLCEQPTQKKKHKKSKKEQKKSIKKEQKKEQKKKQHAPNSPKQDPSPISPTIFTFPVFGSANSIWHRPLAKIYILLPVKPVLIIASLAPKIARCKNSDKEWINSLGASAKYFADCVLCGGVYRKRERKEKKRKEKKRKKKKRHGKKKFDLLKSESR